MIAIAAIVLCATLPTALVAAQGRPNSPVVCATCHAGVAAAYNHAEMRHALEPEGANPVLEGHPLLTARLAGFTYTVQTKDGHSTYSVTDGSQTITIPIRWMFGHHSQTWVLENDGKFYESLVTFYPQDQSLAITPGDQKIVPHSLEEALGRKLSTSEMMQCFDCHSTGATSGVSLTLDRLQPGVDCARCHAGAEMHLDDAAHDNFATLPASLKKMNAEDAANFCGQCHRTWSLALRNQWHGPSDVRFQPYRLQLSRCYIGNDARISCLACHNPHQPVNQNTASYDPKCLACHDKGSKPSDGAPVKLCPVAKTKCVTCHMPKVELPSGHMKMTDHLIRIVRAGDNYPD